MIRFGVELTVGNGIGVSVERGFGVIVNDGVFVIVSLGVGMGRGSEFCGVRKRRNILINEHKIKMLSIAINF